MLVYEFGGKSQCDGISKLQEILKHRSKNDSNEFELRTDSQYPFLTVLVKKEFACVHFFEDESDCGYYAYLDNHENIREEYIVFNMGSEDSETEISRDLIIPLKQAYIVAEDFFLTNKMSPQVKWFEL